LKEVLTRVHEHYWKETFMEKNVGGDMEKKYRERSQQNALER
jgi:hypothetical protein